MSKKAGQRLPLWLIAAIGAIAAGPFVSIYAYGINSLAADIWPGLGALMMPATFSAGHLKSAALSGGRAIVLWIAFVVIFHEALAWARFAPPNTETSREDRFQFSGC